WWGVTMALFLPRWLYLGPLPVLARGAGTRGEWAAEPATREGQGRGASGLPSRQRARSRPEGVRVRILSFNLGTVRIDARLLPRLIEQERIDLIAFQEGSTPSPGWAFTRCWVGPDLGSDHLPRWREPCCPARPLGSPPAPRPSPPAPRPSPLECCPVPKPTQIHRSRAVPGRGPPDRLDARETRLHPRAVVGNLWESIFRVHWMTIDSASGSICP
ncbi:MAG: hypothetical protein JO116_04865, partial [Planctomycetaceae bacterium]|nr:hypothetical protein [Planctomycetaceae bacterium]